MRGEYRSGRIRREISRELPPRARRIRLGQAQGHRRNGTTSACAENTEPPHHLRMIGGNYLRVRGEYHCPRQDQYFSWELPPRARRIPTMLPAFIRPGGTTSACAENTLLPRYPPRKPGNYLRVRGEYNTWVWRPGQMLELPPRARRILSDMGRACLRVGTTSACAENTRRW